MIRAMRVAAFIGASNSGKTTLICAVVRHFVACGERVAAIKHTHHGLNEDRAGDTGLFLAAGANPVILAGEGEAVLWTAAACRRLVFDSPTDLLHHIDADRVFVEGFKSFTEWPQIEALVILSRCHPEA